MDRPLIRRRNPGGLEPTAPGFGVLDLEAEVPLRAGVRLNGVWQEVKLELAVTRLEPDKLEVGEGGGHLLLAETEDTAVEGANLVGAPARVRRGDVLESPHAHRADSITRPDANARHILRAVRRLEGKVALVTGGGSGIGRAVALRLAAEGGLVAVSGRRAEPLADAVDEVERAGGRGLAVTGDVSREDDATRMVEETVSAFGRLDVLVNNAGSIRRGVLLHELSTERWEEQIRVNLTGVFLVTRAALRAMLAGDGDRSIVVVSSTLALLAAPGVAPYTAAKGALLALTRSLAVEYADRGIRVNCVCPAIVDTPLAYVDRPNFDERKAEFAGRYPLGRLGEPKDVAGAVAYLASEESAWVTGSVLTLDGGLTAAQ